jgi:hypothetical protein
MVYNVIRRVFLAGDILNSTMNLQRPTRELAQGELFRQHPELLPANERIRLSYKRAEAIVQAYSTPIFFCMR